MYEIYAAFDKEFDFTFPVGTDVAFIDEVCKQQSADFLDAPLAIDITCRCQN